MNIKWIALIAVIVFLLAGESSGVFPQDGAIDDANIPAIAYKQGEIIVKFKKPAADKLEK